MGKYGMMRRDSDLLPVVLVDYSVHCHCMLSYVEKVLEPGTILSNPELFDKYVKALWALRLSRPADMFDLQSCILVPVLDTKVESEYWRSVYLRERLGEEYTPEKAYKAGRKEKPPEFYRIKEIGLEYLGEGSNAYLTFHKDYMEADDLIAEAFRAKLRAPKGSPLARRHIYINSVDHDLLQLVTPDVTFASTHLSPPRVKDVRLTLDYIYKKTGYALHKPQQFAWVKNQVGDIGDNLPKGSGVELYDLVHPPQFYDSRFDFSEWDQIEDFEEILNQEESNVRLDHREKAIEWIEGMKLPVPAY